MTMMKVIRDGEGAVINIGDWDLMVRVEQAYDETGEPLGPPVETIHNPLPDGAWEDMADVTLASDGGRVVIE